METHTHVERGEDGKMTDRFQRTQNLVYLTLVLDRNYSFVVRYDVGYWLLLPKDCAEMDGWELIEV